MESDPVKEGFVAEAKELAAKIATRNAQTEPGEEIKMVSTTEFGPSAHSLWQRMKAAGYETFESLGLSAEDAGDLKGEVDGYLAL